MYLYHILLNAGAVRYAVAIANHKKIAKFGVVCTVLAKVIRSGKWSSSLSRIAARSKQARGRGYVREEEM